MACGQTAEVELGTVEARASLETAQEAEHDQEGHEPSVVEPVQGTVAASVLEAESPERQGSSLVERRAEAPVAGTAEAASFQEPGHQRRGLGQQGQAEPAQAEQWGRHDRQHGRSQDPPSRRLTRPWSGTHRAEEGPRQSWR